MSFLYSGIKGHLYFLFALVSFILNTKCLKAQFNLTQNLRVDSQVEIYSGAGIVENYIVEEFIDKQEGNVHVRVLDVTNTAGSKDLTSYYRIKETNKDVKIVNNWILRFNNLDMLCRNSRTSEWQLKGLSNITSNLFELNTRSEMLAIKDDRTAIGPSTLLQIVQVNSRLFSFLMKAFNEKHLNDMYYFVATFPLRGSLIAKMICSIPVQSIKGSLEKPDDATLDNLSGTIYPKSVIVNILDKDKAINMDPFNLINGMNDTIQKRVVSDFNLIQERSPSRHKGLRLGSLDERNPFTLPSGAGCRVNPVTNMFFIDAYQFSGLFDAKDFKRKRFIAFDRDSSHLRIDSLGEYKMIYDMKRKRLVYVEDSSKQSEADDEPTRCAQSYRQESLQDDALHEIKNPEDVIGVAKYTGLFYLGTKLLEDGSHCVVYEREIAAKDIPLISRLSMRININMNNRFFLVYYLVDELAIENGNSSEASHERLWIKRIELTSVSPVSKFKILNSQVTFSEFTWSLESASEDSQNRELMIRHPVRAFDTIECVAARDQTVVEFLVAENNPDTSTIVQKQKVDLDILMNDRLEFMEESVMSFLTFQRGLIRSKICDLDLNPASQSDAGWAMLVKAKLIEPLKYTWESHLVGWIDNVDTVPLGKHGTFVSQEPMARYECFMKLALRLDDEQKINMLYCPNVGCGYITDFSGLQVMERVKLGDGEWPSIIDNYYLCEVHKQTKDATSVDIEDNISGKTIERLLDGHNITIDTSFLGSSLVDQLDNSKVLKGSIKKVSTRIGLDPNSMGDVLREGLCFTNKTQYHANEEKTEVQISELSFGLHHSLVHCHKACQLHAGCQTYSYHKKDRVCTLTNIEKSSLNKLEKFVGFSEDANCVLYSMDSIHLFEVIPGVLLISLDGLTKSRKMECYVTMANLTECANLCHTNEFNCHRFEHFPMNNHCVLEDKNSILYKRLHTDDDLSEKAKLDRFMVLVGRQDWYSYNKSNRYKRNYKQHFAVENSKIFDVDKINSSVVVIGPDRETNTYSLGSGPIFLGLDDEACLRECSIVEPKCFMVDYYLKPIAAGPRHICATYQLKKIDSNATEMKLTSQSAAGFVLHAHNSLDEADFAGGDLLKSSVGGHHYYLAGDNLWLRLNLLNFNFSKLQNDERNQLEIADLANGEELNISTASQSITCEISPSIASNNLLAASSLMAIGLVSGLLLTLNVPFLTSDERFERIKVAFSKMSLESLHLRGKSGSAERSHSRMDFVELADID